MVTVERHFARPVCVLILILFAVGPLSIWAARQLDSGVAGVVAAETLNDAPPLQTGVSRPLAAIAIPTADFRPASALQPAHHSAIWFDAKASAPPKSGSWWSRRTTAQKTWFIVGCVAGAAGIYAIANHHSGGGGGGGY